MIKLPVLEGGLWRRAGPKFSPFHFCILLFQLELHSALFTSPPPRDPCDPTAAIGEKFGRKNAGKQLPGRSTRLLERISPVRSLRQRPLYAADVTSTGGIQRFPPRGIMQTRRVNNNGRIMISARIIRAKRVCANDRMSDSISFQLARSLTSRDSFAHARARRSSRDIFSPAGVERAVN